MKRRALIISLLAACTGGRSSAPPPADPVTPTARVAAQDGPTRCDEYDEVVAAYVRCEKIPQPMRARAQADHDQAIASRTETSCMLATTPLRQLYNDNGCYLLQPLEAPVAADPSAPPPSEIDPRLPSCDELLGLYATMAACDAVPEDSRADLLGGIESMRAMWQTSPDLPDDEAALTNDSCAESIEPVREQLDSMGCAG